MTTTQAPAGTPPKWDAAEREFWAQVTRAWSPGQAVTSEKPTPAHDCHNDTTMFCDRCFPF